MSKIGKKVNFFDRFNDLTIMNRFVVKFYMAAIAETLEQRMRQMVLTGRAKSAE